jgi:acyl-CoA thioester hydrolase
MDAPNRFRFSVSSRVDIADTDLGAVVYYGRYPHHIDRAAVAYRRSLGIDPLGPAGHLFVVRSLQLDYHSSARFDDELRVWVRTARMGRTSHVLEALIDRLVAPSRPERVAEARLVIVGLDRYGGRPSRVPPDMRRAIEEFEDVA